MKKLATIETCRGIAALLVVAYHAILVDPSVDPNAPRVFLSGGAGVDFFFVLSGFLIAFVHHADVGRPERLFPYARKRLLRIYPVYWVVVIGLIVMLHFVPTLSRAEKLNPLFEVQSLFLWPQNQPPVLGVSWSLSYEIAFYFVFGCLILNRAVGGILIAVWLILIVVSVPLQPAFPLAWLADPRVLEFFLGIAVSFAVRWQPSRVGSRVAVSGGLIFVALGAAVSCGWVAQNHWESCLFGVASAVLIYGLASGELAGDIPPPPDWLVGIGAASYSIYLVHYPVLVLLGKLFRRMPPAIAYWVAIPAAASAGVVFHRMLERPLNRVFRPGLRDG